MHLFVGECLSIGGHQSGSNAERFPHPLVAGSELIEVGGGGSTEVSGSEGVTEPARGLYLGSEEFACDRITAGGVVGATGEKQGDDQEGAPHGTAPEVKRPRRTNHTVISDPARTTPASTPATNAQSAAAGALGSSRLKIAPVFPSGPPISVVST